MRYRLGFSETNESTVDDLDNLVGIYIQMKNYDAVLKIANQLEDASCWERAAVYRGNIPETAAVGD